MQIFHLIVLLLSLAFFVLGFSLFSLQQRSKLFSALLFLIGVTYVVYSLFYCGAYYFTGDGIDDSVVYHLMYGLHGAGFTEYKLLLSCILGVFLVTVMGILYTVRLRGKKTRSVFATLIGFGALLVSSCLHPATMDIWSLSTGHGDSNFYKYYRSPRIVKTIGKPKNLVFIYVESLERSYFNEKHFPGLVRHLKILESEALSFNNIGSFPNTGWTIAGMVASQCGIPLVALSHGNSMAGMDTYLEGATCMGDLLASRGYDLTFMGGASLDFAGKGSFYRTHGFRKVVGKEELLPLLPDASYISGWGLYDESLFGLAHEEFERLSRKEEPFGLFLINLDTHGYDHYSRSCNDVVTSHSYNRNIACTDFLLTDFIQKIRQSPTFENTLIVIASDHLHLRKSAKLRKIDRRNLFFILDPEQAEGRVVDKKGTTLDIGPTVLYALGYEARLGLGRNLFKDYPAIVEEIEVSGKTMASWKNDLMSFWLFPEIREHIVIDEKNRTVLIDGKTFKTPVLIEYDRELKTKIRFELYTEKIHKSLRRHLAEFGRNKSFLLVEGCQKMGKWLPLIDSAGMCYVNGMLGSEVLNAIKVNGEVTLSANELRHIQELPVNEAVYSNRVSLLLKER